ncbi:MAG TPA: zinc-dependent metalloprotease [Pseudobdellovibrionaceae bacterium]|nr:zinc-dependent metalloprotease [Pseudobdellovibrionaceae bacterium]
MSRNIPTAKVFRSWTLSAVVAISLGALGLSSCSRPSAKIDPQAPTVLHIDTEILPSVSPSAKRLANVKTQMAQRARQKGREFSRSLTSNPSAAIASRVTFDKATLLNRDFLFGSDLQYSTIGEEDGMLLQSIAIGHVLSRFVVQGDRLQLRATERYRFESNINQPQQLIAEYPIVAETPTSITVEIHRAATLLGSLFGPGSSERVSWIRSIEFVPQGNYLLIESTVEMADGSVVEFMESSFPRDTLVPASADPLLDDPRLNPQASRYGFLSQPVWLDLPAGLGRMRTATAKRFDVQGGNKPIEWWVTPNIPQDYLEPVRHGVEAWNRYSQSMWGKDMVRFMGVLPKNVKLGDPRYNVINWDSVMNASSAYASQASDPETGITSHGVIYLPYAWIEIGREFWETGSLTQTRTAALKAALERLHWMGERHSLPCFFEGERAITLGMKSSPEVLAKELLKGVLFHEVGHVLGLAHNFKGSLSYDPDAAKPVFSNSIMEYNSYALEDGAFDAHGVAQGPLLEYDRQIISVLYNNGADVKATDPQVPFCDDGMADAQQGGVDPFCVRYDIGRDPTQILQRWMQLIQDPAAKMGRTHSLATALTELVADLGDPAEAKTEFDILMSEYKLRNRFAALTSYYVAQGLGATLRENIRVLKVFRPGSLSPAYDEAEVRQRVETALNDFLKLRELSPATKKAFFLAGEATANWLKQTAWFQAQDSNQQQQRIFSFLKVAHEALENTEQNLLTRVRGRVLGSLQRTPNAPFFLGTLQGRAVDFEAQLLGHLKSALTGGLILGQPASLFERQNAATALRSYMDLPEGQLAAQEARAKAIADARLATDAAQREALRQLAKDLE